MIKKIIVFIIAFFALILIIAALLPASYRVERSVLIKAPVDVVFWQVADLKNYISWNPWSNIKPNIKNTLSKNTQAKGSTWEWQGKKAGSGKLTIIDFVENKWIETKIEFYKPWKGINYGYWKFESTDEGKTKVSWTFEGKFSYPFERFMYFYMDEMLGEDFDKGLANLKQKCEKF